MNGQMKMKSKMTFKDITTLLYVGPAIIHADIFYREELYKGNLYYCNRPLHFILKSAELLDNDSKLTNLGNEVFSCIELIRYYVITGRSMSIYKKPVAKEEMYDVLRRGLGEHTYIQAVDYLDYLSDYITEPPEVVVDIGGGDGSYLEIVGERYEITKGILIDKDIESAAINLENLHPNSTRYQLERKDISMPMSISPYKADLVLMNEILHLNDDIWWAELLSNALTITKPVGQICIGEVQPEPAFDWRMKAYTDYGRSISLPEFMQWININYKDEFVDDLGAFETPTHWFIILTKRKL